MTRKDFQTVKKIKISGRLDFYSLVILPTHDTHVSGFRCMEFVLMDGEDNPIGRVGGCSDALVIEQHHKDHGLSKAVHADLLPCGLLRMWTRGGMFVDLNPCSSFDVIRGAYVDE